MTNTSSSSKQLKLSSLTRAVYVAGSRSIITILHPVTGLSIYGGESLEQLQQRYPGAVEMHIDEASRLIEADAITTPAEISADQWDAMLNCLPPMNWRHVDGGEVFQMSELTCGRVTGTCARIGSRFWQWQDIAGKPSGELVAKAAACLPVKRLLCSCCGAETRGRQWHNRDTGFGSCERCASLHTVEQIGITGVHHSVISSN